MGINGPPQAQLHYLGHGFIILVRFDHFLESLGIAPNMLTHRLNCLIKAGLLERGRYSERPPRDEYLLTEPPATSGRYCGHIRSDEGRIPAEDALSVVRG